MLNRGGGQDGTPPMENVKDGKEVYSDYFMIRITWNKISRDDLIKILKNFDQFCFNDETPLNKSRHFQIYAFSKIRKWRKAIRKLFTDHNEDIKFPHKDYCDKGRETQEHCAQYCIKSKSRTPGTEPYLHNISPLVEKEEIYKERSLDIIEFKKCRLFQKEIINIFKDGPINRQMWWFFGDVGLGKTDLLRYVCHHMGVQVLGGESRHMLSQAYKSNKNCDFCLCLAYGEEFISFRTLEKIQDGLFACGFGTECNGMCLRPKCRIVVIGNEPPDVTDKFFHPTKWIIKKINKDYSTEDYEWKIVPPVLYSNDLDMSSSEPPEPENHFKDGDYGTNSQHDLEWILKVNRGELN